MALYVPCCADNLGSLLQVQGEYEAVCPYYKRALVIREAVLGERHPDMALSLNNLAVLHAYTGQFEEAIALMRRALTIREVILGPQHPRTQSSQQSLAFVEEEAQRVQGTTPQPREEQIAVNTQQAEEVIASALAMGNIKARAQQTEAAQEALSPDIAQLREHSRSSAPGDIDAPDGSVS